jgi:hypothetical protein
MRHVLHLMQPARRAGRRRGRADRAVRVPRDQWVSQSATSTVTIRIIALRQFRFAAGMRKQRPSRIDLAVLPRHSYRRH